MQKLLWDTLQYGSAALGAALLISSGALAAELPTEQTDGNLEDKVAIASEESLTIDLAETTNPATAPIQSIDELAQAVPADQSLELEPISEDFSVDLEASADDLAVEGLGTRTLGGFRCNGPGHLRVPTV